MVTQMYVMPFCQYFSQINSGTVIHMHFVAIQMINSVINLTNFCCSSSTGHNAKLHLLQSWVVVTTLLELMRECGDSIHVCTKKKKSLNCVTSPHTHHPSTNTQTHTVVSVCLRSSCSEGAKDWEWKKDRAREVKGLWWLTMLMLLLMTLLWVIIDRIHYHINSTNRPNHILSLSPFYSLGSNGCPCLILGIMN